MKKFLFLALIIVFSCKNKEKEPEPYVKPTSNASLPECFDSPFRISEGSIDFAVEKDTFTASFPQAVSYTLTLKGKSSGAIKSFSNTSDTLAIKWSGENENGIDFQNEDVEVKLEIPCQVLLQTIHIKPNPEFICASIKSGLNISSSNADLNLRPDTITASFSNSVLYSVKFEGKTSGALKTYEGFSDTIGIIWKGESDNSRFFLSEEVSVTLTYKCGSPITKMISIKPYDWSKEGLLISDFDGSGIVSNTTKLQGYNEGGWSSYFDEASPGISVFQIMSSPLTSVQKSNYLTIKGKARSDSWFVGGFYFTNSIDWPDDNPDNLYLNMFINHGDYPVTLGIGAYGKVGYKYILPTPLKGWNLVSIRLSEFKKDGESLKDLNGLIGFDFGLNCVENTGETVEANVDYMIITKGKPLFQ